ENEGEVARPVDFGGERRRGHRIGRGKGLIHEPHVAVNTGKIKPPTRLCASKIPRDSPPADHRAVHAGLYASGSKPTISLPPPTSSTGRLIIDGCLSINPIALAAERLPLSFSGNFLNVVPARFRSVSQPTFFAQRSRRSRSIPAVFES